MGVARISVELTAEELRQVGEVVSSGEFASSSAVLREALRFWLHEREEEAWRHGDCHMRHAFESLPDWLPHERVELLFDAADAKA